MSTLADKITEALGCDVELDPDASPECSQPYFCAAHAYDSTSEVCSLVKDVAAVVAEWLTSTEAVLIVSAEILGRTATAGAVEALAALAAEAVKGAGQ